jgi:hypothetical protein
MAVAITLGVAALGSPVSAQSPSPTLASTPQPFPLFGLGRIGYALPEWDRGADQEGIFVHPGTGIDAAVYTIVMPPADASLDDRVAARVAELQGDMDHATDLVASTLDTPSGLVGRVTRLVTGEPAGIEGSYLFSTCLDGTALEISFMQPATSGGDAAFVTTWDDMVRLVTPCHADVRIVPTGVALTGRAAQLDALLRSWGRRQIGQWAALRDLVTHGTPRNLQAYLARATSIRDATARIDREGRADLARLYPEPFAMPPMVVAMATAGLDVPAALDRLGDPTSRKDVQTMEAAAETAFGRWLFGMQEAIRSLGLGDANGDLTRP